MLINILSTIFGHSGHSGHSSSIIPWNFSLCTQMHNFQNKKILTYCRFFLSQANHGTRQWVGMVQAPASITQWDTGMPVEVLKFVGAKSVTIPEDFVSIRSLYFKRLTRFFVFTFCLLLVFDKLALTSYEL